jgi:LCP family protein required for cell wall assembly
MSEYPDDWFRDAPGGRAGAAGSGDPTTDLPVRPAQGGQRPAAGRPAAPRSGAPRSGVPRSSAPRSGAPRPASGQPAGGQPAAGQARAPGNWPQQPPPASFTRGRGGAVGTPAARPGSGQPGGGQQPGGPGGYPPRSTGGGGGRAWLRPRRIFGVLAVLVALILVGTIATYFDVSSKLHHKNVLVDYAGRPAGGAGTNWLIAGSDTRQGLSRQEERKLSAGSDVSGHRSDTIMILHMGSGGKPILISVPRDSYVDIPGYGGNKINAAYDLGGARLLARTVQDATGLRIDHYMEIGFGGFVSVVNAVGGVRMCLKFPLHDAASGVNLRRGCQTLDGVQALAYVRDRHNFASQDLQREQDQRLLLKALLSKLTSTGTLLNPFASIPAATGAASTLSVSNGTSLTQLASLAFALRNPETTTMPIANSNFESSAGDAVLWDSSQVKTLVSDLNDGTAVPRYLITGSHQAS